MAAESFRMAVMGAVRWCVMVVEVSAWDWLRVELCKVTGVEVVYGVVIVVE